MWWWWFGVCSMFILKALHAYKWECWSVAWAHTFVIFFCVWRKNNAFPAKKIISFSVRTHKATTYTPRTVNENTQLHRNLFSCFEFSLLCMTTNQVELHAAYGWSGICLVFGISATKINGLLLFNENRLVPLIFAALSLCLYLIPLFLYLYECVTVMCQHGCFVCNECLYLLL